MTIVEDGGAGAGQLDLYAIAPTLFGSAGAHVDTEAMADAAAWIAGRGIVDILIAGSYGELQSLTDDERVAAVRAVRAVPGIRSVMACAVLPSTDATVRLALHLADEGADSVMVGVPLAAEITSDDIVRHFAAIAERVPVPLVVYNNPVFGLDLAVSDLERLVGIPGYWAVKQGTRSLRALSATIPTVHRASAGRVRLLAASDLTGLTALYAGADGLTSTNSWAFPGAVAAMVAAAAAGDWADGRRLVSALEPYFDVVRRLGQPRAVKAAMQSRGLGGGGIVRLPYVPLDESEQAELEAVLEKCDAALAELRPDLQERSA